MFDGIKSLDLSVSAAALLANDSLTFGALVDTQTGAVLNPIQQATDRGLTFTLIPTKADRSKYRVELAGSLHRYSRDGLHNADDFTAADLRAVVGSLARTYGIDAEQSKLNSVEFGVNLPLPFPVADLLRSLICYHGVPFTMHTGNGFDYYQAKLQQYVLKVYDKGSQYGLPGHMLRFEIKVLRMHYLHRSGVSINVLSDLLNPAYYPVLGRLLADALGSILFDEPLISKVDVPTDCRELLLEGRNPRYWQRPERGQPDYDQQRKQQQRDEIRFRKLLIDHRPGGDWQSETAALLLTKWDGLTVDNAARSAMEPGATCPNLTGGEHRGTPLDETPVCPNLTGVGEEAETGHLSQFNTKDVGVNWDSAGMPEKSPPLVCGTVVEAPQQLGNSDKTVMEKGVYRESIGNMANVDNRRETEGEPPKPRPTASQLRANPDLLARVEKGRKQYAKGSKESREERAAHHLRNDDSNRRNNLKRSINKVHRYPTLPGLDLPGTLRLNDEQRGLLDH